MLTHLNHVWNLFHTHCTLGFSDDQRPCQRPLQPERMDVTCLLWLASVKEPGPSSTICRDWTKTSRTYLIHRLFTRGAFHHPIDWCLPPQVQCDLDRLCSHGRFSHSESTCGVAPIKDLAIMPFYAQHAGMSLCIFIKTERSPLKTPRCSSDLTRLTSPCGAIARATSSFCMPCGNLLTVTHL